MSKNTSTDVQSEPAQDDATVLQRQKNRVAIHLVREWLVDESGYDEATWPKVKKALEENRLSDRNRFAE